MSTKKHSADYVALLVNYFEPTVVLPVEIAPGFSLRHANETELGIFRNYDNAVNFGRGDSRIHRYHISFSGPVRHKTNEDFTGYVIEFGLRQWGREGRVKHSPFELFEFASAISTAGLRAILICESRSEIVPYPFTHSFHRHTVLRQRALARFLKGIPKLGTGEISEIQELLERLTALDDKDYFVIEAIRRFMQGELVSRESDFHVFGLFALIEFLATHAPAKADGSDSLTKQISTKCPRIVEKLILTDLVKNHFTETPEDRLWKILYGYRSAIAHGGRIDFSGAWSKGGYADLKSRAEHRGVPLRICSKPVKALRTGPRLCQRIEKRVARPRLTATEGKSVTAPRTCSARQSNSICCW